MVVSSYMLDCWDAARYDTEFKNTVLKIENVDAEGKCNNCGQIFKIKDNDRKCPNCGTYNEFVPVSGMDLEIKEVEVPEE